MRRHSARSKRPAPRPTRARKAADHALEGANDPWVVVVGRAEQGRLRSAQTAQPHVHSLRSEMWRVELTLGGDFRPLRVPNSPGFQPANGGEGAVETRNVGAPVHRIAAGETRWVGSGS
eukprot:952295-Prymnesium_polylepis.1